MSISKVHVLTVSGNSVGIIAYIKDNEMKIDIDAIDMAKGAHKSPEYIKIHPLGQMPAATLEDGSHMWESAAIMQFLATQNKAAPMTPLQLTAANWRQNNLGMACRHGYYSITYAAFGYKSTPDEVKEALDLLEQNTEPFKRLLNGAKFLGGDKLCWVDYYVAPLFDGCMLNKGYKAPDFIKKYVEDFRAASPAYKSSVFYTGMIVPNIDSTVKPVM